LLPLVRGQLDVEVVDIDSRADWQEAFSERIPVVEFEGRVISQYKLDAALIRELKDQLALN